MEKMDLLGDKAVWLMGNHDIGYHTPENQYHIGYTGWSLPKAIAIDKVIPPWYWDRMRLAVFTQGFMLSHAGISLGLWERPDIGLTVDAIKDGKTQEIVEREGKQALIDLRNCNFSKILAVGGDRGGYGYGGITWHCWYSFRAVPFLNQIVGHTPSKNVRKKITPNSKNYCLDTHSRHYGLLEDGVFRWPRVSKLQNNGILEYTDHSTRSINDERLVEIDGKLYVRDSSH